MKLTEEKIFGEVFSILEKEYRGEKNLIDTKYQNLVDIERNKEGNPIDSYGNIVSETCAKTDIFAHGFFIPENVYIVGCMNNYYN